MTDSPDAKQNSTPPVESKYSKFGQFKDFLSRFKRNKKVVVNQDPVASSSQIDHKQELPIASEAQQSETLEFDRLSLTLRGEELKILEKMRKRNPEEIHQNFKRNMNLLHNYFTQHFTGSLDEAERVFDERSKQFKVFFQESVFPDVVHGCPSETSTEKIVLKSAEKLAKDEGKSVDQTKGSSHEYDIRIGNTNRVFANLDALPSRSLRANRYQITSRNGWVVSADVDDMHLFYDPKSWSGPLTPEQRQEYFKREMKLYSDNIYSIPDFENFFSSFCAAFFVTPVEAIQLLRGHGGLHIMEGDYWKDSIMEDRADKVGGLREMRKIKDFYRQTGVFPPIAPEYQFDVEVEATKYAGPKVEIPNASKIRPIGSPPPIMGYPPKE